MNFDITRIKDAVSPGEAGREYMSRVRTLIGGRGLMAYVQTFGCQQNEADSERIAGMAVQMGYRLTDTPENASLIIVNTCAVREHAEIRALSFIGQYKHIKEKNPGLIIGVCGCMVSQSRRADQLKHSYPYVDFTFGTSALYMLPELVFRRMSGGGRVFPLPEDNPPVVEGIPVTRASSYRAWVSVMYGCNNFCSYCIVPYVRGRERSRAPEQIEDEVRDLVKSGCREITLLGQNVNSYGRGADFDCNFATLLSRLSAIPGDYRLGFMTSHPKDATHALIDVMASSEHIAHRFHLPVQSGSDRVLAAMNRGYTVRKYEETVAYIREKIPDVTLTTDIIVGFPGETDDDFAATLDLVGRVGFDMIYSFAYSPRSGTPAASLEPQVPDSVKSERLTRLIDMQTDISARINNRLVGQTLRVLCCGRSKNDFSVLEGRTDGGKIVLFEGDASLEGSFVELEITEARPFALRGRPV